MGREAEEPWDVNGAARRVEPLTRDGTNALVRERMASDRVAATLPTPFGSEPWRGWIFGGRFASLSLFLALSRTLGVPGRLRGTAVAALGLILIHQGLKTSLDDRWVRRHRRRAGQSQTPHAWLVCPRCHYPIDALAPQGQCPEYGLAYKRAAARARRGEACPQVLPTGPTPRRS